MSATLYLDRRHAGFGGLSEFRDDFRKLVPAIGWMDIDARMGSRHLGLPSDLYLITVHCDDTLTCAGAANGSGLEVMVTSLMTVPGRFCLLGHGHLAVALLTPLGMLNVLRAPLEGLTDRRVPLAYFCGYAEQCRLRHLLMSERTVEGRMQAFGRWLETRALEGRSLPRAQARVAQAASVLAANDGMSPDVPQLASRLAVTRRQLERDFRRWVGIAPAGYSRLGRFQRAAAAMAEGRPIIDVAMDCGFADQSHLTRVVRELSSLTPRQLQRDAARPERAAARAAFAGRLLMLDLPAAPVAAANCGIERHEGLALEGLELEAA